MKIVDAMMKVIPVAMKGDLMKIVDASFYLNVP